MDLKIDRVKIVTTVPSQYTNKVRNAMCVQGAGKMKNYYYCSTYVDSVGTFIPNKNANPFIGEINKLDFVDEDRLEIICDIKKIKKVIKALKETHPYEEPPIDIYPLLNIDDLLK